RHQSRQSAQGGPFQGLGHTSAHQHRLRTVRGRQPRHTIWTCAHRHHHQPHPVRAGRRLRTCLPLRARHPGHPAAPSPPTQRGIRGAHHAHEARGLLAARRSHRFAGGRAPHADSYRDGALPMKLGFQAIRSVGLAAALCAGLVLAAGARLVALSLEQHAVQARSAAQSYADQAAQALQSQLQRLVITAPTRAAAASQALATSATPAASGLTTLPTHPDGFWLMNDGRVLGAAGTGRERARAIASRWQPSSPGAAPSPAAASTSAGAPANSYAPVAIQEGTGWLIATRVAVQSSADSGDGSGAVAQPPAWAVVYRDLDDLLVGAHLDRAGRLGYDFSLAQAGPTERVPLPLASTRTEPLSQPARARITLPGGTQAWQLDVRPRSGWFPASDLVVESSLVLLVAWLAALGVADAAKHLSHLRSALEASRERLHNTQRRLSEELEQRERLQRSFDHAHYHDSFTGLPNRRYFLDQVDRALREMRTRSGREIAALLISVGRYKVVTDTLGHTAGDELMVQITRLANQALAGQEFVLARWADDELALLVSAVHSADGVLHIARVLQQALQTPIEIRRHRIMAATSMGATYVESGLQRAEEVLREA